MVDELGRTLDRYATELGSLGRTIEERPRATLTPGAESADTGGQRALAVLAELAGTSARTSTGGALAIERTIGEGGMGIVRLATQQTLGRKVAVKTLKSDFREEKNTLKLLREAWVTGALEHPNIVPVYDVALDEHQSPIIVLKRIDGVTWVDLLPDEATVRGKYGARDPFEWHLRVLLQVCSAVHFAHSRGVLHRDLKPENVMIGEFGEVYLVDWGIAISMRDDGSGRMPLATHGHGVAGTPAYMAPEMLDGDATRLGPRTDVYLLGAVLYEVVTGRAPHEGETFMAIVQSVVMSAPSLGPEVPGELAAIIRRAMARDPEDRFASADELRLALADYLTHRGSETIAAEAQRRLTELERDLARADLPRTELDERLYRLFGECRFGFRAALDSWPDNQVAADGLHRAIHLMIAHELEGGDPRAASTLLSELALIPEDLRARVDTAVREKDAEQANLEKLRLDQDPSVGRRTRLLLGSVLGVLWTGLPLAAALLQPAENRLLSMLAPLGVLVLLLAFGVWARESLNKTAFNRRFQGAAILTVSAMFVLHVAAAIANMPVAHVEIIQLLLCLAVAGMLALTADKCLWYATFGFGIAFLFAAARPDLRYFAATGANLGLSATLIWLWRPRKGTPGW